MQNQARQAHLPGYGVRHKPRIPEPLVVLALLAVAGFFRLWRIEGLPPGLSYDEAAFGHLTLRILAGELVPAYELGSLHSYLAAPFVWLLGQVPLALRLPEALAGTATAAVVYLFVQEAFERRLVAFLAGMLFAVTYEAIHVSRLAFPPNPFPLVQVLAYYLFWRGWRRGEGWSLGLSGVCLGLSLHTYQASLALVPAMALVWAERLWRSGRKVLPRALVFWLAFLVPALPYGLVVLPSLPDSTHYGQQFIFNPAVHEGQPVQLLARQLVEHAGLFGLAGDQVWRHNLPGRPLFGPFVSALFWGGLALTVARVRSAPHRFLLLQMVFLLLPGLLARTDTGPMILHLAGILVPACVFTALLAEKVLRWAGNRKRWAGAGVAVLLGVILTLEGARSYVDYFQNWASQVSSTMSFDETFVATAQALNDYPHDAEVWVLPVSATQPTARARSLDFVYTGRAPLHYVPASSSLAPARLAELAASSSRVGLVEWDPQALQWAAPVYGDEAGVLRFLLERTGRLVHRDRSEAFTISLYDMTSTEGVGLSPAGEHPARISFAGLLMLESFEVGVAGSGDISSGETLWVTLGWSAMAAPSQDYKVALLLKDQQGHKIASSDPYLRNGDGLTSAHWEGGSQGWSGLNLTIPPGTPPGSFRLEVSVYAAVSGTRLTVLEGKRLSARSAYLADLDLSPAGSRRKPVPQVVLDVNLEQASGTRLLGYDDLPDRAYPGDTMVLALYWQALQDSPPAAALTLEVVSPDTGSTLQAWQLSPGNPYAVEAWRAGEWYTERHDLTLDRSLPAGTFRLTLKGPSLTVDLGSLIVQGWQRRFQDPAVAQAHDLVFGDELRLAGHSVDSAQPGGSLRANLCWEALQPMDVSYITFLHLLDAEGRLAGQVDAVPGQGRFPTTGWLPGEFLCVDYALTLGPDLASGEYTLVAGVYDPLFEERLTVSGAGGQVIGDSGRIAEVFVGTAAPPEPG